MANQQTQLKSTPTEEEKAAARKEAEEWCEERLADSLTLILDTETTGILSKDPETEICQISIINTAGRPVFSALLKPNSPMGKEAHEKHGIAPEMVELSPTFPDIAPLLAQIIAGHHLVAYNAGFDIHLITHLFSKYGCPIPEFQTSCAMEAYAKWLGLWSVRKKDWKWHKLPQLAYGQAHDSLTDCVSTLLLMKKMVGDFSDEPDPNDIDLDF
jgi:DNA polymerase III subunit epsilon